MASPLSQRPTFTREQLAKYFSLIYNTPPDEGLENFSAKFSEIEKTAQEDALTVLTILQQRQLSAVPFSNVKLHYSQHRSISLDPDQLFHKLVERRLGGYCMENTELLAIVIRSLGYQFYTTGARVSKRLSSPKSSGGFTGFHMVLIITIDKKKYMVDVGFGSDGPVRPLPLEDNKPVTSIAPAQMRLVKDNIDPNVDRSQRLWIYQTRPDPDSPWRDAYCFYEIEFLPEDYGMMNFMTSQHRSSIFTQKFVIAKFLLNEAEDDIEGTLWIAGAELKRNFNGNLEKLATMNCEADRISALEKWFNVHLLPMEVRGINGSSAEIQPS